MNLIILCCILFLGGFMIYFSLKEPLSYQKICQEIEKLLNKEIKNKKQAESTLLVIKLSQIIDQEEEIKKLEHEEL